MMRTSGIQRYPTIGRLLRTGVAAVMLAGYSGRAFCEELAEFTTPAIENVVQIEVGEETLPVELIDAESLYPIDLPTALRLADAQNPQIAFARERIEQALAIEKGAKVLWLPNVNTGATWSKHEGTLQETIGQIRNTSRNSLEGGLGAAGFGSGPPMIPGLSANFQLADAIFQPLAARRAAQARTAASLAATNDMLLAVAVDYLGLMRAYHDAAIAEEAKANNHELEQLTAAYARTGQGLRSDADRVQAEQALRVNDVERARENVEVASARLVQRLDLDPTLVLKPIEPTVAPIQLVAPDAKRIELLARALSERPELADLQGQIAEAVARFRREKYAPLMPNVQLGASYGSFGGGTGSSIDNNGDRVDLQAIAYWQLRNLGFGDTAAKRERRSIVRQTEFAQQAVVNQVEREVVEAHAQVVYRHRQIAIAKNGVEAAVASYRLNFDRIKGAQGLPIEVLQSIQALAAARREYLRAVIEYNVAQFSLQRAIGQFLSDGPEVGCSRTPSMP